MNQTKSTEQEKKEKDMNQLAQKKRRKKKKTKYINRMKFLGKGKSIKQFNDSMQ